MPIASSPETIIGAGVIGAVYGAGTFTLAYRKARGEFPPFRVLARKGLSEATEWAGAMFLTDLLITEQFPENTRMLGEFLTVALWLEAIFPKLIGER